MTFAHDLCLVKRYLVMLMCLGRIETMTATICMHIYAYSFDGVQKLKDTS